jgi:hypothetical protein
MAAVFPLAFALLALAASGLSAQAAGTQAAGTQTVVRKYAEARGAVVTTVEYRIFRDGQSILLSSIGVDSADEIRWTPGSGTTDWHLSDSKTGDDLRAQRSGNMIHVTGTLKNRPVDRQVKVDGAPWYQDFGPLMEELLPAGSSQKEFWVLDPADLAAHKMQVRRTGTERVTVRGTAVDAAKIHFSPAGALAPFWGADFWYRQGDGLWVTSRLPEHNSVTVSTVEELTP